MVARPPRPRFHVSEVMPEFVVWSEDPAGSWLQLPRFFAVELPASGPGGLWLQADGCCSRASWVAVEVSVAGNIALARGWQTFARARGLGRRCTLHFKYDGGSTLYVRVFGEDGRRAGFCPETNDGRRCSALVMVAARTMASLPSAATVSLPATTALPPATTPAVVATTSRRARFEGGNRSSHRRASVKREEGSG